MLRYCNVWYILVLSGKYFSYAIVMARFRPPWIYSYNMLSGLGNHFRHYCYPVNSRQLRWGCQLEYDPVDLIFIVDLCTFTYNCV